MAMNLIQKRGPFNAGTSIYTWTDKNILIKKIAVQINPSDQPIICRNTKDYSEDFLQTSNQRKNQRKIKIGNNEFYMGWTGILELSDLEINTEDDFYFLQEEPESTIVDLILDKKEVTNGN